jgi:hypothetical protein
MSDIKSMQWITDFSTLMLDPAHKAWYFCDANMIIAYQKNEIPIWNKYVDFLSQKGKHFFVTNRIKKEIIKLPAAFHVFESDDADYRARMAYPHLLKSFDCKTSKFSTGLHWLLESGYCMSINEDIPLHALGNDGNVFAITSNAHLIRRFIRTEKGRKQLEQVVDLHGLDHLADIRGVCMKDGSFQDFAAFSTE